MSTATEQKQNAFREFQKAFFTSVNKFNQFTRYDIKMHGYILLNNIGKGFPALMNHIMNLKGFGFEGFNSFEILRALQQKMINGSRTLPSYLFYKTEKTVKEKKSAKKTEKGLEFSVDVKADICSILQYDDKTYEYLKYSKKVQDLGRQLIGDTIVQHKTNDKHKSKYKS